MKPNYHLAPRAVRLSSHLVNSIRGGDDIILKIGVFPVKGLGCVFSCSLT